MQCAVKCRCHVASRWGGEQSLPGTGGSAAETAAAAGAGREGCAHGALPRVLLPFPSLLLLVPVAFGLVCATLTNLSFPV